MEERRYQRDEVRGEWLRFGVLIAVMLGTVLVVWAIRPFVASRVIPAFLGDHGETHEVSLPMVEEAPAAAEGGQGGAVEAETAVPEAAPAEEAAGGDMEAGGGAGETAVSEPYPAPDDAAGDDPEAGGGVGNTAEPLRHTVQPGDSLFRIAQQYNVTVEQIVAANQIGNPNRIAAGDVLVIPQP